MAISDPSPANDPSTTGHPTTISDPVVTIDPAFKLGIEKYIRALTAEERQLFEAFALITPRELIARIQSLDQSHPQASQFRKCATRVDGFFNVFDRYLKPLAICIAHSPGISSLEVGGIKPRISSQVVGGIKLIVDVRLNVDVLFKYVR